MYAHNLRARVNPRAPEAQAICDRCGFLYHLSDLSWQYEWRGNALANLRLLVCDRCLDRPNPQLKPRIIPPDPVPVRNPRPAFWAQQEVGPGTISPAVGYGILDFSQAVESAWLALGG
jgi:hypothetical protein